MLKKFSFLIFLSVTSLPVHAMDEPSPSPIENLSIKRKKILQRILDIDKISSQFIEPLTENLKALVKEEDCEKIKSILDVVRKKPRKFLSAIRHYFLSTTDSPIEN